MGNNRNNNYQPSGNMLGGLFGFLTGNVLLLLVIVALWAFVKPVKRLISDFLGLLTPSSGKQEAQGSLINGIDTTGATIDEQQASEIANKLFRAMDGPWFGTSETEIISALQLLQTKGDLNKVRISFGVKKYFGAGGSFLFGDYLILEDWLKEEVSQDTELYKYIVATYQRFGVTF